MINIDDAIEREKRSADMHYIMASDLHTDGGVYLAKETRHREDAEYHESIANLLEELKMLRKERQAYSESVKTEKGDEVDG